MKPNRSSFAALAVVVGLIPLSASADYQQRLTLGAGLWHMGSPSQTDFELGGEYEYKVDPFFGIGAGGNYIFSSPGTGLVAAPEVFFHPFTTDFFVSASPLFQFGDNLGTKAGVRFGTLVPIPMGVMTLLPSLDVDLVGGSTNLIFGIGFAF